MLLRRLVGNEQLTDKDKQRNFFIVNRRLAINYPLQAFKMATNGVNPIYLGIDRTKPGRLPFQFKGNNSLYGCKLPVDPRIPMVTRVTALGHGPGRDTQEASEHKPFFVDLRTTGDRVILSRDLNTMPDPVFVSREPKPK